MTWPRACLAVILIVAACSPSTPVPSRSVGAVAAPTNTPSEDASPIPSSAVDQPSEPPPIAPVPERALASSGSIAVVRKDGSLWVVDAVGRPTMLADALDAVYGFPTWSPDGSRIAAIRSIEGEATVVVFDLEQAAPLLHAAPRVIFRNPAVAPFYLSWNPDGEAVSFLGTEADDISLRIAPADGSAPVDGSGPGAEIGTGSPFYYDWIDAEHLLAHIGSGAGAFLGEIATTGGATGPAIDTPGIFRSADVSGDGRFIGYVRAGEGAGDSVVVAARDGSSESSVPVVGMAAVDFSPTDDVLAAIGAIEAGLVQPGIPIGPLRLIDAGSGESRTLLDGPVLSFAWSPDGSTIAAIRLVKAAAGSDVSIATGSPAPSGRSRIRLSFVDVTSGRIRSQPEISPGSRYVNSLLTYFDQYALSHRLWAPDSSSILLPQVDAEGITHVDVLFPDGEPPVSIEGEIGFWSP